MIALHMRHGWRVLVVLLLCALAVDAVRFIIVRGVFGLHSLAPDRYGIGEELFGVPNVLFVWLFCQQLGFFLFDGFFRRLRPRQLWATMAVGAAAAVGLVPVIGYSWNMLTNQWPPTVPMALMAVVQVAGLTLLHRPLSALTRVRAVQGAMFVIGSRLMTVYLWHLPLVMVLIGVELLLPLPLPHPGGAIWWWTRVPFLLLVLVAVWVLSLALARFERMPPLSPARFDAATPLGVALFLVAPLAITAYGLDFPLALVGVVGTTLALWLTGSFARRRVAENADPSD